MITSGNWEVPGFGFNAGAQARINITNNAAGSLTFSGAIFRVMRSVG